jgi:hypothetical protein
VPTPPDAPAASRDRAAPGAPLDLRSAVLAALFVLLGLGLYVGIELIRPIQGLGNNDVAGIAYEADLILAGGLPYRDTIELKSPGPFFLVAAAWTVFGRSAWTLHLACHLWVMLGAVGVGVGTWWLESGDGSRTSPALRLRLVGASVGLYLAVSGPFESNYTTWMMPPYVWAFALAVVGLRTGGVRWHVAAGFAACLAFFGKTHGFVLGAAIPFAWAWVRTTGGEGRARLASDAAWPAWISGAMLGATPLVLLYAANGAFRALVEGVLPFGKAAEYSARDVEATPFGVVLGVLDHQWEMMPTLLVASLAASGLCVLSWALRADVAVPAAAASDDSHAGGTRRDEAKVTEVRLEWPLVAFWILSLIGGGLGGLRYFSHYAPQYVAPMVWLACSARPWRALASSTTSTRRVMLAAVGAGLLLVLSVGGQRIDKGARGKISTGYRPTDSAERAGAYIAARTSPDDRIQALGWRGWPVYFWAQRRAPGRLYKELGAITEYNRNGRFQPPKARRNPNLRFKPGPYADELLRDFKTNPPAFVIKSIPFFPDVKNDPIREFEALNLILRREYVFGRRFGALYVFERREHREARLASGDEPTRTEDHDADAAREESPEVVDQANDEDEPS